MLLAPLLLALAPAAPAPPPSTPPSTPADAAPRTGPEVIELTVSAAPLPDPPLRHRLTVPPEDRLPGKPVNFWYRAQLSMLEFAPAFIAQDEEGRLPGRAARDLLAESPADLAARAASGALKVPTRGGWYDNALTAARRRGADWDYGVDRMTGREAFEFVLPEFQNARDLAGMVALRGRVHVGDGDYDAALRDAAVGLRLAEDCGAGPFVICDLVGMAVRSIVLHDVVLAVVAAPDSPNLYHALAELPDPAAGLADSWEPELSLPLRLAPWLAGAEDSGWPGGRWRAAFETLEADLRAVDTSTSSSWVELAPHLAADSATDAWLAAAPAARDRLVAAGRDPAAVAAMPAGRAVAADWGRRLRAETDRLRLLTRGPLRDVLAATADDAPAGAVQDIPLAQFFPAVRQAALAGLRKRTDVAALRVVEALRAHAARTGGWPETLGDIEGTVTPGNPLTGVPFGYRAEDGVAVLKVVLRPGEPDDPVNYVFRLTLRDE